MVATHQTSVDFVLTIQRKETMSDSIDGPGKQEPRYYSTTDNGMRLSCVTLSCVTCGSDYVIFMPYDGGPSDKCRICLDKSEENEELKELKENQEQTD